jgi:integrase
MASVTKRGRKLIFRKAVPVDLRGVLGWEIKIPLVDGLTEIGAAAEAEARIRRARSGGPTIDDKRASTIATMLLLDRLTSKSNSYDWDRFMPKGTSVADRDLVQEWLTRHLAGYRAEQQREREALEAVDTEGVVPMLWGDAQAPAPEAKRTGPAMRFSAVAKEYFAAEKRPLNYRRASEQFVEQCGDLLVQNYTEEHAWKFRNWLSEAKDEKRGQPLAGQTKNNKLSANRSIFKFAITKRYRKDDPFRDVAWYDKKENRKKKRRLLTKDELHVLFVEGERDAGYRYWAPLMCLFTGMRREEAIQLRVTDISDNFKVWHFVLQPGEGQSTKSDEARVVPIHKELIRLGFLDFVKAAKKSGREWLFDPQPTGNAFGQWWGRYMNERGVPDTNVDLHAVRGCFITYASQLGVPTEFRMNMVGHARPGNVHNTYIYEGPPLTQLRDAINRVVFPINIPKIAAMAKAA